MTIAKEAFRKYDFKEKEIKDIFTLRLNKEEREMLNKCKIILEQPKDSTCIKTLATIGANVIHDKNISFILGQVFKNKKNNARIGIVDFE